MTLIASDFRAADISADGVHVRHVRTHAEFLACVALQLETWGAAFTEIVCPTILSISQRLGGVTAGAFADDGTLLGFVFGMTGVKDGAIVHWSDMLAVRNDMQSHGIGRRLKEFQRDALRGIGVTRMYWTYDPLVARNAHFNLNLLRVRVVEYVPDMYGADTGSALHSGMGTDRFVVDWDIVPLESTNGTGQVVTDSVGDVDDAPILNAGSSDGGDVDVSRFDGRLLRVVRVQIPPDIFRVQAESIERAKHWRKTTRDAFQWALANGYTVQRLDQNSAGTDAFYVLVHSGDSVDQATGT